MFKRKKKNPFQSLPFHSRGLVFDALVRYQDKLSDDLIANGAFDEDGNFISENDSECDSFGVCLALGDLIAELYKLPM